MSSSLRQQSAALRCAAMDGGPDDPSWKELAATIGCELHAPDVGDTVGCEMLTAALYWPKVGP